MGFIYLTLLQYSITLTVQISDFIYKRRFQYNYFNSITPSSFLTRPTVMKKPIIYTLSVLIMIILYTGRAESATIVLITGATINGKIIERSGDRIIIQDAFTNNKKKIKNELILCLVLYPADLEKEEKKSQPDTGGGDKQQGLVYVLQPTLGLLPGIAYPFGKVGNVLGLGYGGYLFIDMQMPMATQIFKIRLGLSAGYMYHKTKSSDASPYLNIIPVILYMKLQFITPVGVRPYLKIGGGITPVIGSGGSSFDPTAAAALGVGYINEKIPYIEFYIEAGMMMAFEKVRGDFITATVGVAYRFGAPPAVTPGKNP
jgi:hypothetical protein